MDQYAENYISENSALRRKLHSKAEAVLILSKELDQCRTERDQFKMMAEQVQDRYMKLKKMSPNILYFEGGTSSRLSLEGRTVSQVFEELKEQNKVLRLEIEDLKQKLKDAHGDMKALRAGMSQQKGGGDSSTVPDHQREELVQQLEAVNARCLQLQSDTQTLLDEKEELVMERDAYKCKVHRMNHQLGVLLHANPSTLFDIDALVNENKYLHERLEHMKEENELSHQALMKYKNMLDKKRNKGSVRLGYNNGSTGMVVSHKQVQQLLENGSSSQLPNTDATLADLRSLCLALLEALQDKTLALTHQKKSNKMLANRVYDLEQRLSNLQDGELLLYPSQILLQGYSSSNVDKDLQLDKTMAIENASQISGVSEHIIVNEDDKLSLKNRPENFRNADSPNNSFEEYGNLSALTNGDSCSSTVTNDTASENEELTIDLLPPQLQELVLNALQDIENSKHKESECA